MRNLVPALALSLLASTALHAQEATAARPTLAVVDIAFFGKYANAVQADDPAAAAVATARVREALSATPGFDVLDSARTAAAIAHADSTSPHCAQSVACARDVARSLGATWVVIAKVSKISNLIWYLSGQVVDVASGRLLLDDDVELKGPRDTMVPRGATNFAHYVARAAERETARPE